jgi:broad specificity phosphatase PhoE
MNLYGVVVRRGCTARLYGGGTAELRALAKTLLILIAFVLLAVAQASAQATTVIVVRHAEKADASADPELSEAGKARAVALADALAGANVKGIYTTQYKRTRNTATPLAEKLGMTPVVITAGADVAAMSKDIAARIHKEHHGETVLVVGHSNTAPAMVTALGGTDVGKIEDAEYDHMYIVIIDGANVRVVKTRYR